MAGQQLQDARDDLRQQGLQLIAGGCTPFMKHRCALAAAIEAVEHQAVEMNIQVGGGAKALDEGDGAGVGFAAFEPCLDSSPVRRGWLREACSEPNAGFECRKILQSDP